MEFKEVFTAIQPLKEQFEGKPVIRKDKKGFGYERQNIGIVAEVRYNHLSKKFSIRVVNRLTRTEIDNAHAGWWFEPNELEVAS